MTGPIDIRTPGTPPRLINAILSAALRTPGLRRLPGRSFGLLTVTGTRTGNRYTTPVQPIDVGSHIVVLSQRHRRWWRNIRTRPVVELLRGGRRMPATATVATDKRARALLSACLRDNPRIASFYRVGLGADGAPDDAALDALLQKVVVLDLEPSS